MPLSRRKFVSLAGIGVGGAVLATPIKNLGIAQLEYDLCDDPLFLNFKKLKATNPWNSWISCEEEIATPYPPQGYRIEEIISYWGKVTKKHGYNFEVPAQGKLAKPIPLKAMGRFRHEAIAYEPQTGYIYQTEDQFNSCIYRFNPAQPGNLQAGGSLEALMIKNIPRVDTGINFPVGKPLEVAWVTLEDVDPEHDTLRFEAQMKGSAVFRRGEGMC